MPSTVVNSIILLIRQIALRLTIVRFIRLVLSFVRRTLSLKRKSSIMLRIKLVVSLSLEWSRFTCLYNRDGLIAK